MVSIPLPTFPFLSQSHLQCQQTPVLKNPWSIGSHRARVRVRVGDGGFKGLEVLYEDGHGTVGISEFIDAMKDFEYLGEDEGGPLRWFCPANPGLPPIKDAPVLLFLPGVDGNGMGLLLHHKALGRVFEVRCLHVPIRNRTPFEELVKFVEAAVIVEHLIDGNKPIYLLGHSFGGCLALSVAARNPDANLVLILSNPATSFDRSNLQPFLPILSSSHHLSIIIPCLLSFNVVNLVKMALDGIDKEHHLLHKLTASVTNQSSPMDILKQLESMPRDTFSWKIQLLKSATRYANSHLHAVKAEVLILASCQDSILPSRDEAERLFEILLNCKVHYLHDSGHSLLLDPSVNLLTIIKGTGFYRHSREHNDVTDFMPPTMMELKALDNFNRFVSEITSPAMFSTLEDGKIVRGLSGIPNDGPVLLVGNHMLLGVESIPLVAQFLHEKRVVLRGIAHPVLFPKRTESSSQGPCSFTLAKVFGGVPVSFSNFYHLLSVKAFVLLYPGGAREALRRKGEEYKLIWPPQPEFVRVAARFGATIVPFGVVGEDDMGEVVLDYDDLMKMPVIKDVIKGFNQTISVKITGESRKQDVFIPCILPKIPGRYYFLFGKPITTKGKDILNNRNEANALYLHVKSVAENCISYLIEKREEDIYRSICQRTLHQVLKGSHQIIPSFEP
ncbi:acyltransferase-like protein At1g54570, chloroplastic isoform X2 [Dioscorea cayenensis subsp. rotundata]|uniref:Acyltransferase-like protein At1g54570, chloroplastic isoform X2 n=1 Tax=Dioscorea cayennensis subsp. rotundata TaxID=55577 RepID=A0AB40BHE9_DIOCR|nr:acyltransferase-like protein At1g54570, chloroplastic isoform X2 [Dioscorea cayenensis subsp. rotundata]